jgi:hypothetical protein
LQNHYLLTSSCLSWLHGNSISCPVSCTFGTPSWYVIHEPPYFWHRTCVGFSKQDAFCLSLKISGANVRWANTNDTILTHKNPQTETFSCDISPAKLRSTARVWNPQGISKLMNKVDCRTPRALLKAIVWAFLATKSFAAGSSTYPCHMACISKSVPRDVISLSDCLPQQLRSAMDETRNSWGQLLSIPFSCSSGFSGA